MKKHYLLFAASLMALLSCQSPNNTITIVGKIVGPLPEKVTYTSPVNGICNGWFSETVQPDSSGNFTISIKNDQPLFVKLRAEYPIQGTLIVEPGKTYNVAFNTQSKEKPFAVTSPDSVYQMAYNKFPDPEHIQLGAREFVRDSVVNRIRETVNQWRESEIGQFEKFATDGVVSKKVLALVKTDRNCYYDAVLATIAWLKDLMDIQRGTKSFTPEFEALWKESFAKPLVADPLVVRSPWFNFYADAYINFREFEAGDFTKERIEELNKLGQQRKNRAKEIAEYLPEGARENFWGYYLYDESAQKKYQKDLIDIYADFKAAYPNSGYHTFISPLVEEIAKFQQVASANFSDQMKFVPNYQTMNSLSEVTRTIGKERIFVDIWATWCGPCKAEFAYRENLKKLLSENNIKMLYISIDRASDSIQWKNMIKFYNLEGYHVLAGENLVAELRKLYDQNGSIAIPWYILIDENGKILRKHASAPSQLQKLEAELKR